MLKTIVYFSFKSQTTRVMFLQVINYDYFTTVKKTYLS